MLTHSRRGPALVTLSLLSGAWTAALLTAPPVAPVAAGTDPAVLPDGTALPTEAVEAPASLSSSLGLGLGLRPGASVRAIADASVEGIPAAALAAYQRAETVIGSADEGCHLTWQLVAAIGRVESDHGRYGGNVLDADGTATPGIYGLPLDGTRGTAAISDTDGGRLDGDTRWDRAVGPMQFIPSTWSVVGVDADGDAQRNPQDIDDAALATAVYLCSGTEDLATTAGQEAAVHRYNRSWTYVDLVLRIMDAYASGDYTSIPTSVSAAPMIGPDPSYIPPEPERDEQPAASPEPASSPAEEPTAEQPTDQPEPETDGPDLPKTGNADIDQAVEEVTDLVECVLDAVPLLDTTAVAECVEAPAR